MKILVLGGTGVIGEFMVEILSKKEVDVYVTSRRKYDDYEKVHYIQGNAQEDSFLRMLLMEYWDVIIDFMSYTTEKFHQRVSMLLEATDQYFFLSSSRVYADSGNLLTEDSPRLLDVCRDKDYLFTDEYALAKARQENILIESEKVNWTIIRPYVTYSEIRMQLGFYEKEMWLYRVLQDRSIVWAEDIGRKITTLSNGYDVAYIISKLIGREDALGEVFHIMQEGFMTWNEILDMYQAVVYEVTGKKMKIIKKDSLVKIAASSGREYQYLYDRIYNRRFDNSKVMSCIGESVNCVLMKDGLPTCLKNFLNTNQRFKEDEINWKYEGYIDRIAREKTEIGSISGWKNKIKYCICRYTPYIEMKYGKRG